MFNIALGFLSSRHIGPHCTLLMKVLALSVDSTERAWTREQEPIIPSLRSFVLEWERYFRVMMWMSSTVRQDPADDIRTSR